MAIFTAFFLAVFVLLTRSAAFGAFFGRNQRGWRGLKPTLPLSEDEKKIALYREKLLADESLTTLQILNLKGIMKIEEASIFLKLYNVSPGENKQLPSLSPATALGYYRRLVVLGDAGAGKTTMLKWLAVGAAQGQSESLPEIPVLISLPEFVRSRSPRLLDYTLARLEQTTGARRAFLEEKLAQGRLLLLFDGLDAIQSRPDADIEMIYRVVAGQLVQFAKKYPRAMTVVTCRRAGWRGELQGFVPLQLIEFDWEDIQDFIRYWTASHRPELFRPLSIALLQNVGVRSLAATPLLLALICLVFERRGTLPQRRSEVYEWCVQVLLEEADRQASPQRLTAPYKQALLRKIALHFHQRGQRDFPREELLQVITPFMREMAVSQEAIEAVLAELVSEQGLLREQGEGLYGFAHISLQEYFTAEAIAENQQYGVIGAILDQPWWQEVVILLAGLGDADRILHLILEATLARPQVLSLACRCLANQPPVNNPDLAYAMLVEAMQLVLDIGKPAAEKALVVEALSQIKDPAVVNYFSQLFQMRQIQQFLRWDLYARVILNLVQLGFAESYPVVFQLLTRPEIDSDLKQKLIDAAVIVGETDGALMDLRTTLPSLSGDVRAKAILMLLQRGDITLVAPAMVMLHERQINPNLKRRLLGALSSLLNPTEFLKQVLPLLREKNTDERTLQMRSLDLAVRRGGLDSLLKLLGYLYEKPDRFTTEVGRRIVLLAGRYGGSEVIPALLNLLDAPLRTIEQKAPLDETLKRQALAAIMILATPAQASDLRQWLRQAHPDYYSQCIAFLLQTFDHNDESRTLVNRFLSSRRENRQEMEKQLRQLAVEAHHSLATLTTGPTNDTEYFYNDFPLGSY